MSPKLNASRDQEHRDGGAVGGWKRFALPTLGDVVFAVVFTFALSLGANLTHRDGDLGRHIRLGRRIIDEGRIPSVDVYSHTSSLGEMVPHEWLSQAAFAGVERAFGFDGIGYLTAFLAALPWLLVQRWLVRRGTSIALSTGLVLLGAAASAIHWASRPHAFTWLFFAIFMLSLEDFRHGRRQQVWLLIPVTAIWANTHGAFIVAFVILSTYLAGTLLEANPGKDRLSNPKSRHLSVVLAASLAVSTLNPAGLKTIANGFSYIGEDFLLAFTREYNSPDFHNALSWPFLVMLLLTLIASSARLSPTSLLLTLSWTAFALYSFRNIPLYALVMAPVLAQSLPSRRLSNLPAGGQFSERLSRYSKIEREAFGGALALLILGVIAISLALSPGSPYDFNARTFPLGALEVFGDEPPGDRVFNEFHWGGYLEYCCYPTIPVFIDGQTDYYGEELTREYDDASRGRPRWRMVFLKYDIDWVLIPPEFGLAAVLSEAKDWEEIYRDDTAVVFVSNP